MGNSFVFAFQRLLLIDFVVEVIVMLRFGGEDGPFCKLKIFLVCLGIRLLVSSGG